MRQLLVFAFMVTATVGMARADQEGAVMCKATGLHLCCNTCDQSVKAILTKVDGLTGLTVNRKATDQVTFTAKSEKVANDALTALEKGGFCCSVTAGSKKMTVATAKLEQKADSLTFKDVHVCCNACTTAVKGLFTDAKITVSGKGAQRNVTIAGKNLDAQTVLSTLQKGGFTGTIEAKK